MQGRPSPDFSLSGLKTAVRLVAERIAPLSDRDVADLCASFQAAIVDVMVDRTRAGLRACREAGITPSTLVVAGGVAANQAIRGGLARLATEAGLPMVAPPLALCGDNGAMIAWAGLERLRLGLVDDMGAIARPRWPLTELAPAAA
jgi:N6-L-threonylcarbamoyladenine synthase